MTDRSHPLWWLWGINGALGQMTEPIVHCIFVSSGRKAASDPRRRVVTSGTGIVRRYQASPLNPDTTPQNSPLLHL